MNIQRDETHLASFLDESGHEAGNE